MSQPRVSLLVPLYNGEKFLTECLDSILVQDFECMEILIADDGSTDGSLAIVDSYATKDRRIRVWKNPQKLGLVGNFNACLQAAKGEYIKFVFQDDKLLSADAVRQMVKVLDDDASVSLVASASQMIDAASKVLFNRKMFATAGVFCGRAAISKCFENRGNPIGEPTVVMFRKSQSARGFSRNFHYLVDLEMWFHLLVQGKFAYLAEQLCAFRKHPQQESEACIQASLFKTEYARLLRCYAGKPAVVAASSRQALFTNIYYLNKWFSAENRDLIGELKNALGFSWYISYFLRHKLTRPFKKLSGLIK